MMRTRFALLWLDRNSSWSSTTCTTGNAAPRRAMWKRPRALRRLHQRIGLPVVTLRPPYIYGPGNPYYREAFFWDRLRAGRSIIIPGDGRRLMQFVYVKDLVKACLKVMDEPNAVGHAF